MEFWPVGALYLIGINSLTFLLFWFDKWMARTHGWRIPELILWLVAALGGSIGALVAMAWFHHKTKKLSFQLVFIIILLAQLGAAGLFYRFFTI
ncbi:MAG: hypothetical protein ACD_43C00088G0002 [uncultured bacterium]|nr:MAG: hypothetical protein ACD_43C00088G0002 [uncultured bacterium]